MEEAVITTDGGKALLQGTTAGCTATAAILDIADIDRFAQNVRSPSPPTGLELSWQ